MLPRFIPFFISSLFPYYFRKFAFMKTNLDANIIQSENVIIADADYIDKVAFDLIVNL